MATTTPIPGKLSKLSVSTDGGTTWLPVLGRVDMTLNLNKGEIDGSHMDSDDWSNFLQGRKDASIDFTLRYLPGDEGQEALIDNYFASQLEETELDVRFRMREVAGEPEFTAKAYVSSLSMAAADEAPQDITGTLRINGAVTKSEQADEDGGDPDAGDDGGNEPQDP
jgi:predicted secreted protein